MITVTNSQMCNGTARDREPPHALLWQHIAHEQGREGGLGLHNRMELVSPGDKLDTQQVGDDCRPDSSLLA